MSVFTPLSSANIEQLLQNYPNIGELYAYAGITTGTVNSNYSLETASGDYILTIFETLSAKSLDYFLALHKHSIQDNLPVAHAISDKFDQAIQHYQNKPVVLFSKIPGKSPEQIDIHHCHLIADNMGILHQSWQRFKLHRENPFNETWNVNTIETILPYLNDAQRSLLIDERNILTATHFSSLPKSTIHADIFHDNVLFQDNRLSGIIDLYFSCFDVLLIDLAILVLDFAVTSECHFDHQKIAAIQSSYSQHRALTDDEKKLWPMLCRKTALRFWLSRLLAKATVEDAENVSIKNPEHFESILRQLRETPLVW